jgi:hypothetical protein
MDNLDDYGTKKVFDQPRKRFEPMNATDARNIAFAASRAIAEKELGGIFELIETAAKKGEFFIKYDLRTLSSHAKSRLKDLGYELVESLDTINWATKQNSKIDYPWQQYPTYDINNLVSNASNVD